jgi:hypothetical protein
MKEAFLVRSTLRSVKLSADTDVDSYDLFIHCIQGSLSGSVHKWLNITTITEDSTAKSL